ncbi:hypothetical protein GCM10009814_27130 [Lapillicoccus jejuensis]
MLVASPHDQALRGGEQALGAAEVEDLAVGAEEGGDDPGFAGEAADGGGGQDLPGAGDAGAVEGADQGVEVDGDEQLGLVSEPGPRPERRPSTRPSLGLRLSPGVVIPSRAG